MPIRSFCLRLLLLSLFSGELAAAEPANQEPRRYDQGPLRIDEFRRSPPESVPGKALTMTRVMFNYEFRLRQAGHEQFEAILTSLDTFAVFLPAESWWHHRASQALLDHEQGHFDIAEISARRLQLAFHRAFKSKQAIIAKGSTAELAKKTLAANLDKVMAVANEQTLRDNEVYDIQTSHALSPNSQREYRRIQLLTLSKLQDELAPGKRKPTIRNKTGQRQKEK